MKKLFVCSLLSLACCSIANAQDEPEPRSLRRDNGPAMATQGSVTPTPEMWFYQQERTRYEDVHSAVRRKAEFRAAQRANRTAAAKWYGFSNSRPTASPTPTCGTYSPTWTSNAPDPYRWMPSTATVVVRPTSQY